MTKTRLTAMMIGTLLLALAGFVASAYWAGSLLVAPNRSSKQAPAADLPLQEVSLESASRSRLSGWFLDSDRACGTVVLLHGVRADKRAMVPRAKFLAAAGYGVLLFDFQAHGESGGDHITFGYLEQEDVAAAMAFAARQRPERPIAVIGLSMGGAAAVLAGPTLGADAVVLEAVYPTLEKAVLNRVRRQTGGLGFLDELLAGALLAQLAPRLGFRADDLRPIDHVASLGAPVLMIAGSKDEHTTPDDSRRLFERAGTPKRILLLEGAGHVDLHGHDPAGYEETLLGFLEAHMGCDERAPRRRSP